MICEVNAIRIGQPEPAQQSICTSTCSKLEISITRGKFVLRACAIDIWQMDSAHLFLFFWADDYLPAIASAFSMIFEAFYVRADD
jgi:hypothetical protein